MVRMTMANKDQSIFDLETPAVLVDLDVVDANIARAQSLFDGLGIGFRPHIKTHKIPYLAELQTKAGAIGIAAQKISEAEVFAHAGCTDIMLCFNLLSPAKIARARALMEVCYLTVVADNIAVVRALSKGMAGADVALDVLVECDTGMGRCGVQSPEAARDLAVAIAAAPGLNFAGLMTYPPPGATLQVEAFLQAARELCVESVGHCAVISGGGTPSLMDAALSPVLTEYRAGTYIYNDRSLVARRACTLAECALTVLATVVSRPTETRAILDSGSKSLTSDLLGLTGYGAILGYPGAQIAGLSEEHGHVDLTGCPDRPTIGQKVQIVPNHVCPVSNLVDRVVFHRSGVVLREAEVAARGTVV
jgi:D-serine deaminase-like pyridoxal phosphate-dependent protein